MKLFWIWLGATIVAIYVVGFLAPEWLEVVLGGSLLILLFGSFVWAFFGKPGNGGGSAMLLLPLAGGLDQGGTAIGIVAAIIALILFVLITLFGKGWGNPGPPRS